MAKSKAEQKRMTGRDMLLIGGLLAAGVAGLLAVRLWMNPGGSAVRITAGGELYGIYPLSEEQVIPITGRPSGSTGLPDGQDAGEASPEETVTNVLQISSHEAKMTEAGCPDKLCVHQKAVSRQGETIVCLPNQVIVEIIGEEPAEYDSMSR